MTSSPTPPAQPAAPPTKCPRCAYMAKVVAALIGRKTPFHSDTTQILAKEIADEAGY